MSWIGVFLFLFFSHPAPTPSNTVPPPPPLGNLIDVGGYRVHLYCTGIGSPTVVVVGGAFSFDWGLVQPEVAKFTRICTYDPSGTAWSDAAQKQENPMPSCAERVTEIHRLLQRGGIPGPYLLVGFSIGGLIGRLYAALYPEDVAGMVIVDHAFVPDALPLVPVPSKAPQPDASARLKVTDSADSPPILISSSPITLGMEDDQNFRRLSQQDQNLHAWAMSINPLRPTGKTMEECSAAVESVTHNQLFPLGDRPLIVISTNNDSPGYERLLTKLLTLSHNTKKVVAENSSHMVIIDEPEVVVASIRQTVEAATKGTKLK